MSMTIDEARQILFTRACGGKVPSKDKLQEAEMLGAEALKRIKDFRETGTPQHLWFLPGETEE